MTRFIIRRLLAIPPLMLGVTIVTFALVHFLPGSPIDSLRLTTPGMPPEGAKRLAAIG